MLCYYFPELGQPGRRAIVGMPGADRLGGGVADVVRGVEVWFADLEMDDFATLALQLLGPRQHGEGGLGTQPLQAGREGGC